MDYGPGKTFEEQEIVEHYVTECRRTVPITQRDCIENGALHSSTAERSFEEQTFSQGFRNPNGSSFLQSPSGVNDDDPDRRYLNTGERDCSRDATLLQTSGLSGLPQISSSRENSQFYSTDKIESYGYDVHEVHTSEGGARIVQTRGSGLINNGEGSAIEQRDRSLSEQHIADGRKIERNTTLIEERFIGDRRPGITSSLKNTNKDVTFLSPIRSTTSEYRTSNGYKENVAAVRSSSAMIDDAYRPDRRIIDSSLSRKNSYKRMQQGQLDDSVDIYTPRSDASLMRGINKSIASDENRTSSKISSFFRKLVSRIRQTEWTPRLIGLLILLLLLLILFFVLLGIIIGAAFGGFSTKKLILYPPVCEECRRTSPASFEQSPSTLYIHYYNSEQTHFEIKGNSPLKSNSFTAVDFETGYIAIADHALKDSQGKHFVCFILPLDRTALPSVDAIKDAVASSSTEVQTEFGWQEYWQFQPEQIDTLTAERKFSEKIEQCEEARWYMLKHTVYTRDSKCSDCYDFCLPDYSIQRLYKYKDDMTLNIRRLDCFRLYVPEWTKFQIRSDNQGGHWQYPNFENVANGYRSVK